MQGNVGAGLKLIEEAIAKRDEQGLRGQADPSRLLLCEVYLKIASGEGGRPSLRFLLRNFVPLLRIALSAESRLVTLVARVRENPTVELDGLTAGRCEMILGLLYKARAKRALAAKHLTQAKRIVAPFGPTAMLSRIDAALAGVGLIPRAGHRFSIGGSETTRDNCPRAQ